jgi:hypothetical protein
VLKWTTLGNYLARPVKVASLVPYLEESDLTEISNATLLLHFCRNYDVSLIGQRFLHQAVASCPIAIAVAGVGAGQAFDDLLREASTVSDSKHIMTTVLDGGSFDDIAEGFLFGVLPSEERFDEWQMHLIIVVEDSGDWLKGMAGALQKWVDDEPAS